jgi:prepilin-type N-terminal cleavage/methylation domain-containing protein
MKLISQNRNQAGFSLLELMIALGIMVVVAGAVFSLMRDSMKVAVATYEMTDAQETLRSAHEYINRDLTNAGDGLLNINNLRVPQAFVSNYLSRNPITDPAVPVVLNLGIITSDNNVPASTSVTGTTATVRSSPLLTDRLTVLAIDTQFVPIALAASAIDSNGSVITVPAADISKFTNGEVYFLTSSAGGTFGAITNKDTANNRLTFANGDTLGLNLTGASGHIRTISGGGTLATSLQRMRMIHYYVDNTGLLIRRVFGVRGAAFNDSVVGEHIVSLQFRYVLGLKDTNGNVLQPVPQLTSSLQQTATRQVEVTLTAETPRAIHNGVTNGTNQTVSMTTNTSVRNMQFRRALQPGN